MSTPSLNPFKRRRRRAQPYVQRRRKNHRFSWGRLSLLLAFITCLIILDLTRARPLIAPIVCAAPVVAAPGTATSILPTESDVPARPLIDPVPDPWDDKAYHCKEGHKKEGGLPVLFSSLRETTTRFISVPAPPATGLLALGFLLMGAAASRRRKRAAAAGAQK